MECVTAASAGQIGIVDTGKWLAPVMPLPDSPGKYLVSCTVTIPEDAQTCRPWLYSAPGGVYLLYAAKLELGSRQTLAHQDASGNWVLNDPSNYDLQYALCSLYSPTTGEWVGNQHSNPNLLDNWYFPDPINQRGQKKYTAKGYTIDRWIITGGTLTLSDSGLAFDNTDGASSVEMYEMLEMTSFLGKEISFSVIANDKLISARGVVPLTTGSAVIYDDKKIALLLRLMDSGFPAGSIWVYPGNKYTISAAKLELGPVQTLAHQDAAGNWVLNDPPPNKAPELTKCQRYQYIVNTIGNPVALFGQGPVRSDGASATVTIPIPNMRSYPALSTVGPLLLFSPALNVTVAVSGIEIVRSARDGNFLIRAYADGLVAGETCQLTAEDSTSRIIFDANL